MSKLSSLTENKYTLRDIFVRNHEVWLAIPLFCYLLTPVVHMIVFAANYSVNTEDFDKIIHTIKTGEKIGDYYTEIIFLFTVVAAIIALTAFISHRVFAKKVKLKKGFDIVPFSLFALVCLLVIVSTIVNGTDSSMIFGFSARGEGVAMVLCYFLVYYFCGSLVRNENLKYCVIYFFILTSVIISALVLINKFLFKINMFAYGSFAAIFYHFNFYAYYLTIAIMLSAALFALKKNKAARIFSFFSLCLNSVVLAFNDSFGGFLACLVAFVFLIVAASIKKGKFSFSALATLLVFLAICFAVGLKYESFFSELVTLGSDVEKIATNAEDADSAGTWRWGLWRKTWEYIKERPFIGYGIEGTVERLAEDTGTEKVHNEYLDYAVEYGIPAALLYIAGLMSIFIKALIRRKNVDNATLVCLVASLGYIGSAFFGNRMIFILPFFFIFLGLANSTEPPYEKLGLEKEEAAKAATLQNEVNETAQDVEE
ncbi:MAG: O-antigen ligase family protein [Clostridia bacterium]|nr:O-antigen ligase family protein [Clostridia bacterium]